MTMKLIFSIPVLLCTLLFFGNALCSQTIPKEELIFLTSEWKGERFDDGRPKISDELIERAKRIGIDDAWTVLKNQGYTNQYEGNWRRVHDEVPIVGRALTAMYMPSRPDVVKSIKQRGITVQGRKGDTNTWPIEMLGKGDVYVADGFGKIDAGTLMGATLATAIYSRTGTGVVFNGSARDLETVKQMKGFNAFVRDFHPSFLEDMVVMGLNTPIRIGGVMVMPGDLVLAKEEGVLFIPAHLADQVVSIAEFVGLKDQFGFEAVKTKMYSSGEIDGKWTEGVKNDFLKWLKDNPELGTMTKEHLDKVLSNRTW
jgi:regulator of RNase E activity RraA